MGSNCVVYCRPDSASSLLARQCFVFPLINTKLSPRLWWEILNEVVCFIVNFFTYWRFGISSLLSFSQVRFLRVCVGVGGVSWRGGEIYRHKFFDLRHYEYLTPPPSRHDMTSTFRIARFTLHILSKQS